MKSGGVEGRGGLGRLLRRGLYVLSFAPCAHRSCVLFLVVGGADGDLICLKIPTCSKELLRGLGGIAQKYDCFVQSHAAESVDEEALVESQHPGQRDVEIYRESGLLGNKTILAHCCRLFAN